MNFLKNGQWCNLESIKSLLVFLLSVKIRFISFIVVLSFILLNESLCDEFVNYRISEENANAQLATFELVRECCGEDISVEVDGKKQINCPSKNKSCLKRKTSDFKEQFYDLSIKSFLKEVSPKTREFLKKGCGGSKPYPYELSQDLNTFNCFSNALTKEGDGTPERDAYLDFVSQQSMENPDEPLSDEIQIEKKLQNYMRNYQSLGILLGACNSALGVGESLESECGDFNPVTDVESTPFIPSVNTASIIDSELRGFSTGAENDELNKASGKSRVSKCDSATGLGYFGANQFCVKWNETTEILPLKNQTQLLNFNQKYLYRDMASFGLNKIFNSFILGAFNSEEMNEEDCKNKKSVSKYLKKFTNSSAGKNSFKTIQSCFKKLTNNNPPMKDAIGLGHEVLCKKRFATQSGCERQKEALSKESAKRYERLKFKKDLEKYKKLKQRIEELRSGISIGGHESTCGSRCGGIIDEINKCYKDYGKEAVENKERIHRGCLPVSSMYPELQKTYQIFQNFMELEKKLLNENPMLAAKSSDGDLELSALEYIEKYPDENGDELFETFEKAHSKKTLDFIKDEVCDDPTKFAQQMMMKNPEFLQEYINQDPSPQIESLLCMARGEVLRNKEVYDAMMTTATVASVGFGIVAAIPSGGTSLVLGGISTSISLGMAGKMYYDSMEQLNFEKGAYFSCVGDISKVRQAQEDLDDALFDIMLEAGLGPGVFIGAKAIQSIGVLKKILEAKKLRGLPVPPWAKRIAKMESQISSADQIRLTGLGKKYKFPASTPPSQIKAIEELEMSGLGYDEVTSLISKVCKRPTPCDDFTAISKKITSPVIDSPISGIDHRGLPVKGNAQKSFIAQDGKRYIEIIDSLGEKKFIPADRIDLSSLENPTDLMSNGSIVSVDLGNGRVVKGEFQKGDFGVSIQSSGGKTTPLSPTDLKRAQISVDEVPFIDGNFSLNSKSPSKVGREDVLAPGDIISSAPGNSSVISGEVISLSKKVDGTPIMKARVRYPDGDVVEEVFSGVDEINAFHKSSAARFDYTGESIDEFVETFRFKEGVDHFNKDRFDGLLGRMNNKGASVDGELGGVTFLDNAKEVYGTPFDKVTLKKYEGNLEEIEEIVRINKELANKGLGPKIVDYSIIKGPRGRYSLDLVAENLSELRPGVIAVADGKDALKVSQALERMNLPPAELLKEKQKAVREALEIQLRHQDGHTMNYFTRVIKKDGKITTQTLAIDNDEPLRTMDELRSWYKVKKTTLPSGEVEEVMEFMGEGKYFLPDKPARGVVNRSYKPNLDRLCKDFSLSKMNCQDILKITDIIPPL